MSTRQKTFIILLIFFLINAYAEELEFFLPEHTQGDPAIVKKTAYILKYNENHEQARVIYKLTEERVKGKHKRSNDFRKDSAVHTGSATLKDYKKSGYDRGHLAPAADMKWSKTVMSESFFLSNMSPQTPKFNRGIWKSLEKRVRKWATENEEIYVVTAGVLTYGLPSIGDNKVSVPKYYFKIILDYKGPEIKGIAFVLPNEKSKKSLKSFAVTIDYVENLTGIDFFPSLSDDIEDRVESTTELDKWSFKK